MATAQQFLDAAYEHLDITGGDYVPADMSRADAAWIEKGDWATLAKSVGAEGILFVQGNPVVVFAKCDTNDPEVLRKAFSDIWCMARPNLLFLASPGELAVHNLTEPPPRTLEEWSHHKALDVVQTVSAVATQLKIYHRAQIESGHLFEEVRFGTKKRRADQSLIQDLRTVRESLRSHGLDGNKLQYAHALIGRSIFIRYLEDRKILTSEYFLKVAGPNREWKLLLESESSTPYANERMSDVNYLKVLTSKEFTYALFAQLAEDFNGDMFPMDEVEESLVTQEHLTLLQGFLRGDTEEQQKLFFWAYNFDFIPIELVSSIYEEFYKTSKGGKDGQGTHYTPPALVDFVLNQVLTAERLAANPTILDPACGSGIFLVEAFRRIVRYRTQMQNGRRLGAPQLRKILREQIRGIDTNEEAIRVAAFSLYLALLHYQESPDILEQIAKKDRLPYLVLTSGEKQSKKDNEHFDILQAANAFSSDVDMKVDVVVGNPPWGDVPRKDHEGREQAKVALEWCESRGCPVGNRERSQAFIWRSLDFLKENGVSGMLVSSGILHKHHPKSKAFRAKWLSEVSLEQIVHFAHVRKVFFPSAKAPFLSIHFRRLPPINNNDTFMYASAKRSAVVNGTQSVILSTHDVHFVKQHEMAKDDSAWKTLWWGNHHDKALIGFLKTSGSLRKHIDKKQSGLGYERGSGELAADWLRKFRSLPAECFTRYGRLDQSSFSSVPSKVHRRGVRGAYEGRRILLGRGISEKSAPKGKIVARLEEDAFCFTHSINGYRLSSTVRDPEILLGILWSSVARYYYFMTSGSWGIWHHAIGKEEFLSLPVRFPESSELRSRLLEIVRKLQSWPTDRALDDDLHLAEVERELDAAVFDLYELSEAERDLIRDMCGVGIEFFYDPIRGASARELDLTVLDSEHGTYSELGSDPCNRLDIRGYLEVFLRIWNRELEPDGEFAWRVIAPGHPAPMLAVVFSTQAKGARPPKATGSDDKAWSELLQQLAEDLRTPFHSDRIYIDGLVRTVSPTQIVIIKRNEGRFWTRSGAREDAEATLLKAMQLDDRTGVSV